MSLFGDRRAGLAPHGETFWRFALAALAAAKTPTYWRPLLTYQKLYCSLALMRTHLRPGIGRPYPIW